MTTYNKIATECPAVQLVPTPTFSNSLPQTYLLRQGSTVPVFDKVNRALELLAIGLSAACGYTCAVGSGLNVTGSGLTATVSTGLASMLIPVFVTSPQTVTLQNNAENWIWLLQSGNVQCVTGSLMPPTNAMPCTLLGMVPVTNGQSDETDESGVVKYRGAVIRRTGDSGKPGDSPGVMLLTKTQGGTYYWDREQYLKYNANGNGNGAVTSAVTMVAPHALIIGPATDTVGPATTRVLEPSDLPVGGYDDIYYRKAVSDGRYVQQPNFTATIDNFYTKAESDNRYYSKTQVDAGFYARSFIDSTYYTKTDSDNRYYTKTQADASYATFTTQTQNDARYYTKTQSDARYALTAHTHPISDVTGLQSALDGKAAASHTHTIANVTGLQSALDSKSNIGHTHAITDVANLQSTLAALQASLDKTKAARVTAASLAVGVLADITVAFGTPFADTNYTAVATVTQSGALAGILTSSSVVGKTASSVTVRVKNIGLLAMTPTVEVVAVHD